MSRPKQDDLKSQICDTCASSFLYEENKRLKKYIDELERKLKGHEILVDYADDLLAENKELKEMNEEYMQSQHTLFMELQKYRKALDRACAYIDDLTGSCPLDSFDIHMKKCEKDGLCDDNSKECWKEWCLDE